ncbi:hypothetical protein F0562_005948 [Nyssa sinensis]|uniref:RING-type domain-containing protein n=1 Tax=Nyssa sinensis TaxID=561372 RepID=A0A5J5AM11_9ASTE|nr:hypothetical protein F0562_005948 [Nyssa sinensis]
MDEEQAKRISRGVPFIEFDQVNSDFALAVALQEQEVAFPMTTIESESDDEDESGVSDEEDGDRFLENSDIQAALEFMEEEDSNGDQLGMLEMEIEEDDIDPDELSYEELIALGEIVGKESRGLSEDQISSSLRPYLCQSIDCKSVIDSRCAICQMEYEEGEIVVALPCDHPYHSDCVSKWLQIKKICPICSSEVSSPKIARIV